MHHVIHGRLLLALSLVIAAPGAAQRTSDRLSLNDSLATWYALGIGAHHLCSGLWVVGRDYQRTPDAVVREDIARFPGFRWEEDFRYTIDSTKRVATVTDPRVGSRSARYNGDQGCTILPAG
ncbi:MAG TPA: hypothetical protein VF178_14600, partial [Gemmatimonadaceae bacterium]